MSNSDLLGMNRTPNLRNEAANVEKKLENSRKTSFTSFCSAEVRLEQLISSFTDETTLDDETRASITNCVASIKSKMSDHIKAHRDVHQSVSKFGKFIDKNYTDDLSTLTSYFIDRTNPNDVNHVSTRSLKRSSLKNRKWEHSQDELLQMVIIEHLLRQGLDPMATDLVSCFGFNADEINLDRFRELSNLVSSIQRGELEPARCWLSNHKEQLGTKACQLEYALTKLEFINAMKQQSRDPAAILHHARQLVPYSQIYPTDFEHLMGSLVFLGRDLSDTPYADLAFPESAPPEPMQISPSPSECDVRDFPARHSEENELRTGATQENSNKSEQAPFNGADSALTQAANLFRVCYCRQLNLSDIDPLCTIFNSGCRLLSRRQNLQRAISCLSKYSSIDGDTLPVAVELDPAAHQHNIFHCPVNKEVVSPSNGPVRLSCGHAISREALESLGSGDRSKIKCPYCPVETYKSQALDLIF